MKGVTKAALYMRLSKDDEQFGDSISIETQRSILSHFVKEHGFSVFDEYVDATVIIGLNQQSLGVQGVAPV